MENRVDGVIFKWSEKKLIFIRMTFFFIVHATLRKNEKKISNNIIFIDTNLVMHANSVCVCLSNRHTIPTIN